MVHRSRVALTVVKPVAWLLLLVGLTLVLAGGGMVGKTLLSPRGPSLATGLGSLLLGVGAAAVGLVLRQLTRPPTWQLGGWESRYR